MQLYFTSASTTDNPQSLNSQGLPSDSTRQSPPSGLIHNHRPGSERSKPAHTKTVDKVRSALK
jgi:hypothetical protein